MVLNPWYFVVHWLLSNDAVSGSSGSFAASFESSREFIMRMTVLRQLWLKSNLWPVALN
jgi:hypothetical protein